MAVTIQDDMWEAACTMPDDQRKDFIDALLRFAFDGEEPDHAAPWYGMFIPCRDRAAMSAKRSREGKESATRRWDKKKPSKAPSKGGEKTHQGTDDAPTIGTHDGSDSGPMLGDENAEVRRDEMSRGEKELTSGVPDDGGAENDEAAEVADAVVAHLNELTSQSFKPRAQKTLRPIRARIREGFSLDDLLLVVDDRCRRWLTNPQMRQYLRPETLFGPKCEGYLNAAKMTDGGVSHAAASAYDQGISLVAF